MIDKANTIYKIVLALVTVLLAIVTCLYFNIQRQVNQIEHRLTFVEGQLKKSTSLTASDITTAMNNAADEQKAKAQIETGRSKALLIALALLQYSDNNGERFPKTAMQAIAFDVEQDLQPYIKSSGAFTNDATQTDGFEYKYNQEIVPRGKEQNVILASMTNGPGTWDIYADGHVKLEKP